MTQDLRWVPDKGWVRKSDRTRADLDAIKRYHRKIAGASERNYRKVEKELDVEIEDLERETRKEG